MLRRINNVVKKYQQVLFRQLLRFCDYHVLVRTHFVTDLSHRRTGTPGTQNPAYIALSGSKFIAIAEGNTSASVRLIISYNRVFSSCTMRLYIGDTSTQRFSPLQRPKLPLGKHFAECQQRCLCAQQLAFSSTGPFALHS